MINFSKRIMTCLWWGARFQKLRSNQRSFLKNIFKKWQYFNFWEKYDHHIKITLVLLLLSALSFIIIIIVDYYVVYKLLFWHFEKGLFWYPLHFFPNQKSREMYNCPCIKAVSCVLVYLFTFSWYLNIL